MIGQDPRMNLVLVAIHLEPSPRSVPLGPAMLASVLKRHLPGVIQTRILDLFLQQSAEACAEQIIALNPHWVGFSIYVWNRALSRAIARVLRLRNPSILLFAGGSEATADPAGMLSEGWLDSGAAGSGRWRGSGNGSTHRWKTPPSGDPAPGSALRIPRRCAGGRDPEPGSG